MGRTNTATGGREATTGVIPGRWALSVGHPGREAPPGFRWVALSELARLESGHTPSRRVPGYWGGDIPWIGIRDATGNHGRTIHTTNESVTQAGIDNSSARVLPAGTVCLSRTASVGYVVTMGRSMATSQDFVNWVCGPELRSRYLHYLLVSEQASVRRFAHGSVHPTVYYPEVKALHVCIPDLGEQEKILAVLRAIDDKIEANEQIAFCGRELASAQFTAAVADSMQLRAVSEMASLVSRGVAPRYVDDPGQLLVLNQKCIRGGRVNTVHARRTQAQKVPVSKLLQSGDVLVNSTGVGTLGRVARWSGIEPCTVDSHVTIVRFDSAATSPVCAAFAMLAAQSEIEWLGEGSTGQTELSRVKLGSLVLAMPNAESCAALGPALDAVEEDAAAVLAESANLGQLRDTLLQGLMSGQLRIKHAEKIVEDAT